MFQIRRTTQHALYAALVLLLGGVIAGALAFSRSPAPREPSPPTGPLVRTQIVHRRDVEVRIDAGGTVKPCSKVRIVSQVSGRVVEIDPDLVSGGFFEAGEVLIRIDPTDYKLAVKQAEARLAQAKASLAAAKAEIAVLEAQFQDAKEDLARTQRLHQRDAATTREVDKARLAVEMTRAKLNAARARREAAQTKLQSAQLALREARLNLQRTTISLPLDGVVMEESVGVGEFVVASEPLATVYATDCVKIPVPLHASQLAWFDVPRRDDSAAGASGPVAKVTARFAGERYTWRGRVRRIQARVDPRSRMVRVMVIVPDPFDPDDQRPPLMPGMFVDVSIHGRTLEDVIPVPRTAVHRGQTVWIAEDGELQVRRVQIAWRDAQKVFIAEGLEEGERIVLTPLEIVTDGMKIRTVEPEGRQERTNTESDTRPTNKP